MKMRILGTNEQEYLALIQDIRFELEKFGPIVELKVPRQKTDHLEVGKAYVHFLNVASAFACYNLLNSKLYMGHPVDILFINHI
jgi:RNA recognition motif-containing protein